jgi:hypothetical protein
VRICLLVVNEVGVEVRMSSRSMWWLQGRFWHSPPCGVELVQEEELVGCSHGGSPWSPVLAVEVASGSDGLLIPFTTLLGLAVRSVGD